MDGFNPMDEADGDYFEGLGLHQKGNQSNCELGKVVEPDVPTSKAGNQDLKPVNSDRSLDRKKD